MVLIFEKQTASEDCEIKKTQALRQVDSLAWFWKSSCRNMIVLLCRCAFISIAAWKLLPEPADISHDRAVNTRFLGELGNEFDRSIDSHIDNLECIGWRATKECSPLGPLFEGKNRASAFLRGFIHNDLPCDQQIPVYWEGSGYCEMKTRAGQVVKVFQKGCREGSHRPEQLKAYFSCHMAASFLKYKNRMMSYEPDEPITVSDHAVPSRGIVMQVYGRILPSVYSLVKVLREVHGCKLPIEFWSLSGEVTESDPVVQQLLAETNTALRIISDASITSYMSKPYSIVYSHFDQVLWLDSDNFPFHDPSFLFETVEFQQNGAIFWKDFWRPQMNDFFLTKSSLAWELFDIPPDSPIREEMEMEAGQLVIDRRRSRKALNALLFLTITFKEIIGPMDLLLGDKDLFRFAFHTTNTPFHYMEKPPGFAGISTWSFFSSHTVCGQTMMQPDPVGNPLFFHRNLAKLKDRKSLERVWEKGMRFIGNSDAQYHVDGWPSFSRSACYAPTDPAYFEELDFGIGSNVSQFESKILFYAGEAVSMLEEENPK
ncbi:Alpha-1,2-mannosyltransferase MNN5 [Seminavis robusta]|uniref:Alpha-1,2-mannosyltransferase MNN5 n=1 Tax=Seminavis robusta TaxID=568900 RepID=A0A9N8EEB1_9STRA|nr:Alpha-1,2-mannosyltransferase MNN5 [Seminavis robusta]|eukprot:Sro967_g225800.1 Alpha-1,2-mannosyltransferase MNN5 (543) ;mRNA; r:5279-6907